MSNLLKSKFIIGFMMVAVLFVGGLSVAKYAAAQQADVTASDIQYAATVRSGSSGQAALIWQKFLNNYSSANLVADGKFGPLSVAAAKIWQASRSLAADGALGAMSRASAVAQINSGVINPGPGTYPAGCSSNSGYSTTTGQSCAASSSLPAGCTSTSGFSSTTGQACNSGSSLPAGCISTAGFSPTTGMSCSGGSSSSGPLAGGAGDVTLTNSNTGVINTVKETDSNIKVMAFKAKADGSDLAVTSMKVEFTRSSGSGSTRLDRYLSNVSVWLGSTKVGSADVADFTNSSGVYSKTIALSNAVVRQNQTETFYVAVSAIDVISTAELASELDLTLDTVRFNDATGAILSADVSPVLVQTFGFDSASADDTLSLTASTSNPQATSFKVKTSSLSDNYLVQAFKLKTGTDAGDVQIDQIPVMVEISNAGSNVVAADNVISSVSLKINGTTYDSNSDSAACDFDGDGDRTSSDEVALSASVHTGCQKYIFTFDNGEVVIPGNSSTEVQVMIKFNDQKSGNTDNYAADTNIQTSVRGGNTGLDLIDAESVSNGDVVTATGSSTSKLHSLSVNAPQVSLVGTPTFTSFFASDTATDVYLAKFVFNVTAGDDDIYFDSTVGDISYDQLGGGAVNSVTLDPEDSSLNSNSTDYLITAGSTEKFTLSYYVEGNNEADKITITDLPYGLTDTADDLDITTGLTNFHTSSVYLGI